MTNRIVQKADGRQSSRESLIANVYPGDSITIHNGYIVISYVDGNGSVYRTTSIPCKAIKVVLT